MSGEFRPEQNLRIESTDNPDVARQHGLTQFDKATGQYTAPTTPDTGQRDGADVQEQRRADADAEGAEQQRAEDEQRKADDAARAAAAEPKKTTAAKAAGSKASQSKADSDKDSDGK